MTNIEMGEPGGSEPSALTRVLTDWHREFCDGTDHVTPVGFEKGQEFGEDGHGEPYDHGVADQCMCGHVPYWMCPDYFGHEYAGEDLRSQAFGDGSAA